MAKYKVNDKVRLKDKRYEYEGIIIRIIPSLFTDNLYEIKFKGQINNSYQKEKDIELI